ncbi:MAG: hypothetical protein M1837_001187 [Sclerophora amabilis]|nr:MAG: hypothetical protein M1837_001187 [Sclerophora amabilis]
MERPATSESATTPIWTYANTANEVSRLYGAHTEYYPMSKVLLARSKENGLFRQMMAQDLDDFRLRAAHADVSPYEEAFCALMETGSGSVGGINLYVEQILQAGTGFEESFGTWAVLGLGGGPSLRRTLDQVDASNVAHYFPMMVRRVDGIVEDAIQRHNLEARDDPRQLRSFDSSRNATHRTPSEDPNNEVYVVATHSNILSRDPILRELWDKVRRAHALCESDGGESGTDSKVHAAERAVDALKACLDHLKEKQRVWLSCGSAALRERSTRQVVHQREEGDLFRDLVADKKSLERFIEDCKRTGQKPGNGAKHHKALVALYGEEKANGAGISGMVRKPRHRYLRRLARGDEVSKGAPVSKEYSYRSSRPFPAFRPKFHPKLGYDSWRPARS